MELHERNRGRHAFAQRIGARALDQLGRIGPFGQWHDPELQVSVVGQLGGAEHRVLAGAVGVEAQDEHLGEALEL